MLRILSNAIATETAQWRMWFELPVFCGAMGAIISLATFFGQAWGIK